MNVSRKTTKMQQILVGVDGSVESRAALDYAANLARETGRNLFLAFVAEPPTPVSLETSRASSDEAYLKEWAERLLDGTARAQQCEGLAVRTAFLRGQPADALADTAISDEIDLVVVGHRGRNAFSRMLLGSVADRLTQISPKPVVVVR
jgi:nucleotide-binding universal stress UspA family protein